MEKYDVIIIGAGTAGLFSALLCAEAGLRVCLFEGESSPGKKLLISGQGKCNITNTADPPDFINRYGGKKNFVRPCLYSFSSTDLCDFFRDRGLPLVAREDGKVFPETERSRDVLDLLLKLCGESGVHAFYSEYVDKITVGGGLFTVKAASAAAVIICTGGITWPSTGSKGGGYALASALSHSLIPPRPALAAVLIKDFNLSECAGISLPAAVSLFREGRKINEYAGALLITHTGVSGPVILDNSRDFEQSDRLVINFLPSISRQSLSELIISYCGTNGKSMIRGIASPLQFPSRLYSALTENACCPEKKAAEVNSGERKKIIQRLTELDMEIVGLEGAGKAMCTAGGVSTKEINPSTMESRLVKGLYFAGEVIDVDGDSGGYNLQFAFSSARAAAKAIRSLGTLASSNQKKKNVDT